MKIKIKHKLFSILLLTSVAIAASLFFFLQWSFDRGFLNYLKGQELEQLDRLAEQLTNYYIQESNWRFIAQNHPLWQQMHSDIFSPSPEANVLDSRRDMGRPIGAGPPPGASRMFGERVLLFDADKNWIIGGPPNESESNLNFRPIVHEGKIIGYLGLMPVKELTHSGDLLFVEQQTESFTLITIAMVALSLFLSYPIAMHLLRPINALTEGTRKLIAGQFKTRIPITTSDELGRLSVDFNILAQTLDKNEKNRQQWVADFSHELRTPLAILRGEIEALHDGVRKPGPEKITALYGEIVHLERLVNDLYELSMSDIGALNYKRVEVNPIGILEGTIELFEKRMSRKGLKLICSLPGDQPCILLADPDRLHQLFTNLLENCLRYTDSPGEVEVKLVVNRERVTIHFQDSMPGVSSLQLPKLFERLYRVEGSRNRNKGGAGLGLAICKNIVDGHHGSIVASASPLGGLLIKIDFPLKS